MSARRIRLSFRPPQKTQQFNINSSNSSSEQNSDENIGLNNWSAPPMPKHVPFPFVPYNSDLTNEIWIFIFTFLSASTQFIQLYRTMFFLSGTHLNNKSVNFHLIDKYLILFIMTMISRRLIYSCLCMVSQTLLPLKYEPLAKQFLKFIFCSILLVILIGCSVKICQKYNYFYLFCLSYPIILYLFIFRLNIEPFLKTHAENDVYICGMPLHSCSANAMQVREEIDMLKTDFNNRFKQVIFTSMLNAYFACFIPCCFVHKATYYDSFRSTQHLFFVWVSGFCQLVAQSFPLKYSDILHRSSQHLGQWNKIGHRSSHPPPVYTLHIIYLKLNCI
jgi:Putative transmembrane protein